MRGVLTVLTLVLPLAACSGKSETGDTSPGGTTAADAAAECTSLCTASGFDAGAADEYEHEVNCFCSGGDGTGMVDATACADMCTGLGWTAGDAYAVDACQCS